MKNAGSNLKEHRMVPLGKSSIFKKNGAQWSAKILFRFETREKGFSHSSRTIKFAYKESKQIEKARQCFNQSITLFEEIGSPRADDVREWLDE